MRLELAGVMQSRTEGACGDLLIGAELGAGRYGGVDPPRVIDAPSPVLVAAIDGFGPQDGPRASRLLAQLLVEGLAGPAPEGRLEGWRHRLIATLERADRRLFEAGRDSRGLLARLTLAIIDRGLVVATVGEAASYVHRRGALAKVSGHDGGGEILVVSGALGPDDARFTRHDWLGLRAPMEGDFQILEPRRGDLLLLCTGAAIVADARRLPPLDPAHTALPEICRQFVTHATEDGSDTDASCLAVRLSGDDLAEPDASEPPIAWRSTTSGLSLHGGLRELERRMARAT